MAYRMKGTTFFNKMAKEENIVDKEVATTKATELAAANKKYKEIYGPGGKYPKGHRLHIPKAKKSYTPTSTQDDEF